MLEIELAQRRLGEERMQARLYGCRRHPIELSRCDDDDGIFAMHGDALRSFFLSIANYGAEMRLCILKLPGWRVC